MKLAVLEDTHFRGSSKEVSGAHSFESSSNYSAKSSCWLCSEAKIDYCITTSTIKMNAQELPYKYLTDEPKQFHAD